MPILSVPQIIDIGDISTYLSGNYIAQGQAYGDRLSQDMNKTIAMVTDALRWQWAAFPDVAEVRAVGSVTIHAIGDEGDNIAVYVNDPELGVIMLGQYTQSPTVYDPEDIAYELSVSMSTNPYGYQIIYPNGNNYDSISVIAREGLGASINNDNHLFIIITPTPAEFICAESGNRLLTQQPTTTYITTETY